MPDHHRLAFLAEQGSDADFFSAEAIDRLHRCLEHTPLNPMAEFQVVCRTADIAVGDAKCFEISGKRIGVYRLTEGFYAIDDPCPHAGASLARGCIEGDVIHCRIHHWGFGIKDGLCREPHFPQHNVQTYEVRVQNDEVSIRTPPHERDYRLNERLM